MTLILGKKEGMIQIMDEKGSALAGTVISAISPLTVTQVKTLGKDGYSACQYGYGTKKEKLISKAEKGHVKGLGSFEVLREERFSSDKDAEIGSKIELSSFALGDKVRVCGITKAKGFAGVVKRHGFHGGPRSHGQKHCERAPGSLGAGGYQRVFKGKRMAGRMGGERVTVLNLRVLSVDAEKGKMVVSGAVPGRRGTLLEITK